MSESTAAPAAPQAAPAAPATPTPAAEAPAAQQPAAEQPQSPEPMSWEQAVAAVEAAPEATAPEASEAQAPAEAQEPATGEPKPLPEVEEPRPKSMFDRLVQKRAREAEKAKLAPLEAELQQRQQAIEAQQRAFAAQQQRLQEAAQSGNLDAYLQQTLGMGVQQYAQQQLEQAASQDPRVTQLQQEIQAIREQSAERERQAQEQLARAERAREMSELQRDIAASGYTHADKLAQLPGFTAKVHAQMTQGGEVDAGKVLAAVAQEYRVAYNRLSEIFGTGPAPASMPASPAQAGVLPESHRPDVRSNAGPTTLPQSAAGEARAAGLEGMSDDDAWNAALAMASQS